MWKSSEVIIFIQDVYRTQEGRDQEEDAGQRLDGQLLQQELILLLPEGAAAVLHAALHDGDGPVPEVGAEEREAAAQDQRRHQVQPAEVRRDLRGEAVRRLYQAPGHGRVLPGPLPQRQDL